MRGRAPPLEDRKDSMALMAEKISSGVFHGSIETSIDASSSGWEV
jgi:hypothetical protein